MAELDCVGSSTEPRCMTVLPSVRFVQNSTPLLVQGRRIIYITEPTTSLLGPLLEQAALAAIPQIEVLYFTNSEDLQHAAREIGAADIVIVSAHGISARAAGTSTGAILGDRVWGLADVIRMAKDLCPSALILASCELGAVDDSHREADAISLAGGALAAGVSFVVAPIWEVDDLPASLFVVEMIREFQSTGDVAAAYNTASRLLCEITEDALLVRLHALVELLYSGPFAPSIPKGVVLAEIGRQVEAMAVNGQRWRAQSYICMAR
jgi:hypothetical protein